MASAANVVRFPCANVVIPEDRQRKELGDLQSLADAIGRTGGVINPICVRQDGTLVAGERRLRAVRDFLKWPEIDARIYEWLSPIEAELIELQENIQREDLTWQEQVMATARYHRLKCTIHEGLPANRAAGPWTPLGTANDIGKSEVQVYRVLRVAAAMEDEEVRGCSTLSGAVSLLATRAERVRAAAAVRNLGSISVPIPSIVRAGATKEQNTAAVLEAMLAPEPDPGPDTTPVEELLAQHMEEERAAPTIITGDFLEWADSYTGPKFDLVHIDFPYGKGYAGSGTRQTGKATFAPRYKDSLESYWQLLAGFLDLQDNLAFPIAHCMFWFDMWPREADRAFYQPTVDLFTEAGWKLVAPYPLIWTKPNEGVASDHRRRPRHCYETALLFSRGDRKIITPAQDWFLESSRDSSKLHLNQKPFRMLKHFLSMLVDENTAVLDPTCGSGMALRAAKELGSPRVLGVELDPDSAEMARYTMVKPLEELEG